MPPSEQVLANNNGFRIRQSHDRVFFERPPATISMLWMSIPFAASAMALLVGIALFSVSFSEPAARANLRTGAVLLWGLSALAFALGLRAFHRLALDQATAGVQLHLDDAGLQNLRGQVLATRAQLSTRTRIDLTDGMGGFRWARVVYLCWSEGEVMIYRSYEKRAVQKLCQTLAGLGIKPSR